jgi:hypothetical protein
LPDLFMHDDTNSFFSTQTPSNFFLSDWAPFAGSGTTHHHNTIHFTFLCLTHYSIYLMAHLFCSLRCYLSVALTHLDSILSIHVYIVLFLFLIYFFYLFICYPLILSLLNLHRFNSIWSFSIYFPVPSWHSLWHVFFSFIICSSTPVDSESSVSV